MKFIQVVNMGDKLLFNRINHREGRLIFDNIDDAKACAVKIVKKEIDGLNSRIAEINAIKSISDIKHNSFMDAYVND